MYNEHKGRYGYRKIAAALCNSMAQFINHKRVQRLLQEMGLRSLIRAKRRCRQGHGLSDVHRPNDSKRDFHATAPNQNCVTDTTKFNVKGQKLYLSVCMDLYNGEIIAHRTARRHVFDLVSCTFQATFRRVEATGFGRALVPRLAVQDAAVPGDAKAS